MPLVVITGIPSSGKTRTANRIRDFFQKEKNRVVKIVSENQAVAGEKNAVFADSTKEKSVRAGLRSEVCRLLNKDEVVILDGLNYIKGFRYELYCASKAAKNTQCTVHCDLSPEDAWQMNLERPDEDERYTKEVFDGLVMRYEAPIGHNRWDSPLFLSLKSLELDCEKVNEALFERKAPPPNQSTQCQPLSQTNFLHELDRVTKDIIKAILDAQKTGLAMEGDEITVPGTSERFVLAKKLNMAELSRAKKQFITYAKSRAIEDVGKLATMFVQYLNANMQDS